MGLQGQDVVRYRLVKQIVAAAIGRIRNNPLNLIILPDCFQFIRLCFIGPDFLL